MHTTKIFEKSKLDPYALVITTVVILFLIGFTFFLINSQLNKDLLFIVVSWVFVLVIFLITWAYHPSAYEINNNALVIHRPISSIVLEKNLIESVDIIEGKEIRFNIRLFGSGGFFGYFGIFRASSIGKYYRYTTNKKNLLLIRMINGKKYLISPNSSSFIDEIRKMIN